MIELLLTPVLAGLGLCLLSGPLGCFIVWRRGAYFGETIAHVSLMGIALAVLTNTDFVVVNLILCVLAAGVLTFLSQKGALSQDTVLGIIAQGSLALGLIFLGSASFQRIDLLSLLMGDILTSTWADVLAIYLCVALIAITLYVFWRQLVLLAVDSDLARAEGLRVSALQYLQNFVFAIFIAIAVKIVGVLLISALLVIPAAAARPWSKSPDQMALISSFIAVVSLIGGFFFSYRFDLPASPTVVCSALFLFFCSLIPHRH